MRTIHVGVRVSDADRLLAFYTAVGYEIVGRVPDTPIGDLTMLTLPADEFVTIELVHDAGPDHDLRFAGGALSHLVIATGSMDDTVAELSARAIDIETPTSSPTTWSTTPPAHRAATTSGTS